MPTEHTFSRKLGQRLRSAGALVWKINDNYAGGVPDFWLCGPGASLWVEAKWIKALPKRDATIIVPKLSPQQALWLSECYSRAQSVVVVCASPAGSVLFDRPETWTDGIPCSVFKEKATNFNELVAILLQKLNLPQAQSGPSS